ncbi:hypothetical protein ACSAZL_11850 [Methanosarcina sp. T3]|uniref:hypothetical protein n=1 Tax=Methanosarcina sp. T3 TaxID=3439062 RepID=UPI003F867B75
MSWTIGVKKTAFRSFSTSKDSRRSNGKVDVKAVSTQLMGFTALYKLTGPCGGNLFFHPQKLLDSKMIIQRHERETT